MNEHTTYTATEIATTVTSVAIAHNLLSVSLFGSYARGEATENSDVDLLIELSEDSAISLVEYNQLYQDFEKALGRNVDILTKKQISRERSLKFHPGLRDNIEKESRLLYVRP